MKGGALQTARAPPQRACHLSLHQPHMDKTFHAQLVMRLVPLGEVVVISPTGQGGAALVVFDDINELPQFC